MSKNLIFCNLRDKDYDLKINRLKSHHIDIYLSDQEMRFPQRVQRDVVCFFWQGLRTPELNLKST
jgi:hypothetical protein